MASKRIEITGVVQGVGFRPFVYQLAQEHHLMGWVCNTSAGVEIEVEGKEEALERFLLDLRAKTPPLARIESLSAAEVEPSGYDRFAIRSSRAQEGSYLLISPDIATCQDCKRELLDPSDRHYRYPFTNCTNCGPRFTIIEDIPYDRPKTTMRAFTMCPKCQAEYEDPSDRRFHAQPSACPVCGPSLTLTDAQGRKVPGNPLPSSAHLLKGGKIVAVKGLGGFHLACDATNEGALKRMRERKRRPAKPLAVMMATLEEIKEHCQISLEEARLLISSQCPILLLPWKSESTISRAVAPRNRYLGAMLPYTPLHHLLLRETGRPLVMTSGNLGDEPIAKDNGEVTRLKDLADFFLLHDRDIYVRCDDSVWMVEGSPQPLRRARGYAPYPIHLPFLAQEVLACGGEEKNTFCFTKEGYAFLSQHIGDLQNLETLDYFEESIDHYKALFRLQPGIIAYDLHPEYLSTKYALEVAARSNPRPHLLPIQHHHAHIVSCMIDNGVEDKVIGVAFDGTGYGLDGRIWGGEFLTADLGDFQRVGHFEYLPMPGGEAAIRRPYRLAAGYLYTLLGEIPSLPFLAEIDDLEVEVIMRQIDKGLNAPLTSSCGRLFDAVSALLGVRGEISYEAQAAIELEMLASQAEAQGSYPFSIVGQRGVNVVQLKELLAAIVADLQEGISTPIIGLKFHETVVAIIVEMCGRISRATGLKGVALSGGVFQNRLLLRKAKEALRQAGFTPYTHHQVPTNDGGISLGQAIIAHSKMRSV
ncbi:MAG: carbamoyltransferase HypF [Anaerolineae bacterium]